MELSVSVLDTLLSEQQEHQLTGTQLLNELELYELMFMTLNASHKRQMEMFGVYFPSSLIRYRLNESNLVSLEKLRMISLFVLFVTEQTNIPDSWTALRDVMVSYDKEFAIGENMIRDVFRKEYTRNPYPNNEQQSFENFRKYQPITPDSHIKVVLTVRDFAFIKNPPLRYLMAFYTDCEHYNNTTHNDILCCVRMRLENNRSVKDFYNYAIKHIYNAICININTNSMKGRPVHYIACDPILGALLNNDLMQCNDTQVDVDTYEDWNHASKINWLSLDTMIIGDMTKLEPDVKFYRMPWADMSLAGCQSCDRFYASSKMFTCKHCVDTLYCSVACQRVDWVSHKLVCKQ